MRKGFFNRTQRTYTCMLGNVPNSGNFVSVPAALFCYTVVKSSWLQILK